MPAVRKLKCAPNQHAFEELTNVWLESLNNIGSRQVPSSDRSRSERKYKFPVKYWDIEREEDSDSVVFRFTLPDNTELSLLVSIDAAILILEVLRLSLEVPVQEQVSGTLSNLIISTSRRPDPSKL
jgi:hypothetical protein